MWQSVGHLFQLLLPISQPPVPLSQTVWPALEQSDPLLLSYNPLK